MVIVIQVALPQAGHGGKLLLIVERQEVPSGKVPLSLFRGASFCQPFIGDLRIGAPAILRKYTWRT